MIELCDAYSLKLLFVQLLGNNALPEFEDHDSREIFVLCSTVMDAHWLFDYSVDVSGDCHFQDGSPSQLDWKSL